MALMTRLQKSPQDNANDITKNLFSLQFESALTEEERELLHLRARSHAISVYQCAQATYFVEILREIRLLKSQLKNPNLKRTTRILQDDKSKDALVVGILGCGRLGSQIAHCLLTYGKLNPSELHISTRRPETLEYLQQRGVDCYYDNMRLVTSVHVVFMGILPSQFAGVADEIKDVLPSTTIIYVPSSSTPLRRLRQMLATSNIVQPEYTWTAESQNKAWNHSVNVNMALENKDVVEKTCPICDDTSDQVIMVNPKLAEVFLFASVNMCSDLGLTCEESLRALHLSMFGESERQPLKDHLTMADFGAGEGGKEMNFPQFDLVQVSESESHITQKLSTSTDLRQAFIKRYWQVFEEYLHIRAYGQLT
ncbi:NADP-dependent oxidoreductase domain-containing protein 1-like [Babylonia areolata]|uniref:NADP-dependent oxidoreductase domain-containing protein 1-like n=1 Tax=Babylonia areolata TaxID=304850 RepID=UPI003FD670A3